MSIESSPTQLRLVQLKADGATPIQAIKAIHAEFSLSLAAAKQEFSASKDWQQEAENADRLHEELIAVLAKEPKA